MILTLFLYIFVSNFYSDEINSPNTTDYIRISSQSYDSAYKIIDEIKSEIENTMEEGKISEIENILTFTKEKIKSVKTEQKTYYKEDNFQKALLKLRKSLLIYFLKTNRYPNDINEMVPDFLDMIPQININGDYKAEIKYVRTNKHDKKYENAIDNTTEYVYFSDPQSIYWGLILINSDKEFNNHPFYKY